MTESIKTRCNAMANHRDGIQMQKLNAAMLADLQALRSKSLGVLTGSATYNTASLLDAAGVTTAVVVTGASLGDMVVSVSLGVDLQGITVTGYVSAADIVSVRIQNESGGTLDLASTTIRVSVLPQASDVSKIGCLVGAATYNTASLADAAGATATITVRGAALGDYAIGSLDIDLQGITATWYVSATDTVAVRIQNETGGTIDLASATLRCRVLPEASFGKVDFIAGTIGHLKGSATFDYADGADGVGESTDVTVTGAALGDFVIISHGVDLQGITATGYVSAADTVTVRFQNESAGTRTLASATLLARTIPYAAFPSAMTLTTLA